MQARAESDTDALCLVAFSLRVQSRTGQWKRRNISVDIRAKTLVVLKKDTPYKAFRWTEVMGSEQLDDSHLRIRFHHHRDYVMQFMFPDDIAPLRRLLELIQTWCASHDEHRESVEDDVSLLMLRPALHMGFVSKHSAAVRHQQWLIVVDGRIQFHRKPSSRWQPYPRRSVPLGPHVVDAQWDAWSSMLVLRVQRTLASSDAQGVLATYLPDCAFRFQNFNGQQETMRIQTIHATEQLQDAVSRALAAGQRMYPPIRASSAAVAAVAAPHAPHALPPPSTASMAATPTTPTTPTAATPNPILDDYFSPILPSHEASSRPSSSSAAPPPASAISSNRSPLFERDAVRPFPQFSPVMNSPTANHPRNMVMRDAPPASPLLASVVYSEGAAERASWLPAAALQAHSLSPLTASDDSAPQSACSERSSSARSAGPTRRRFGTPPAFSAERALRSSSSRQHSKETTTLAPSVASREATRRPSDSTRSPIELRNAGAVNNNDCTESPPPQPHTPSPTPSARMHASPLEHAHHTSSGVGGGESLAEQIRSGRAKMALRKVDASTAPKASSLEENARLSVMDELKHTGRSKLRAVTPETKEHPATKQYPSSASSTPCGEPSFADELVRRLASRRQHIETQPPLSTV